MSRITPWTSGLVMLLTLSAAPATPDAPASPYQPLGFLIGHCWQGTLPDGRTTDEHCFSWIYDGKFVRDEHVVRHGGQQPDAFGESIYLWNAGLRQLQYLYIESAGGYSRGTVSAEGAALVFPPASFREGGQEQIYRNRWQRRATDAYDVVTEFRVKDQWTPGLTVHMTRRAPD